MGEQLEMFEARQEPLPLGAPRTLTEALAALGYTHRESATPGVREVVDTVGRVVTRGRASDVWQWLADGRPEGVER